MFLVFSNPNVLAAFNTNLMAYVPKKGLSDGSWRLCKGNKDLIKRNFWSSRGGLWFKGVILYIANCRHLQESLAFILIYVECVYAKDLKYQTFD